MPKQSSRLAIQVQKACPRALSLYLANGGACAREMTSAYVHPQRFGHPQKRFERRDPHATFDVTAICCESPALSATADIDKTLRLAFGAKLVGNLGTHGLNPREDGMNP